MNSRPSFRPSLESLTERIAPHAGLWTSLPGAAATFGVITPKVDDTAAVATQFRLVAQPSAEAGSEAKFMLVALDATGRPVKNYTGTVHFTSTNSSDTLPADYTFTASDRGRKVFSATVTTIGTDTITATDTTTSTITATAKVDVKAAAVATQLIVKVEKAAYVGGETRVLVAALDANGRPVASFTGTVTLTSSESTTTVPASYTFAAADHGVHIFLFTATTAGTETITATDSANAELTGTATVTVSASPTVAKIIAIAKPIAKTSSTVTIYLVAVDANNRPVPTYTGTVNFTSASTGVTLPASYSFTASDRGVKAFTVTLPSTTGDVTITATDAARSELIATTTIKVSDTIRFGGQGPRGFGFGR
jgi:hypothetical protein